MLIARHLLKKSVKIGDTPKVIASDGIHRNQFSMNQFNTLIQRNNAVLIHQINVIHRELPATSFNWSDNVQNLRHFKSLSII